MAVSIIEKYVIMRMNAYTLKHRKDLAEWMARPGAVEQGYWDNFNAARERSERWFADECDKINGDPNMSYRDRAAEIVKLADRRVYPAWSGVGFGRDCGHPKPDCQHSECGFLRTYVGDGEDSKKAFVGNRAAVGAELLKLQGPEWATIRNGQATNVPMTSWDLTLFAALTDPQDGSVSVPALGAAVVTPSISEAPAPPALAEVVSEDDPRWAAVQDVFKRTCQFCGEVRKTPLGKRRHEPLCNDNPNRASLNPAKDRKLAEEARAAAEGAGDESVPSEPPVEEPVAVEAD